MPDGEQERGLSGFWLASNTLRFIVYVKPVNGTIVESVAQALPLVDEEEPHND